MIKLTDLTEDEKEDQLITMLWAYALVFTIICVVLLNAYFKIELFYLGFSFIILIILVDSFFILKYKKSISLRNYGFTKGMVETITKVKNIKKELIIRGIILILLIGLIAFLVYR